VARRLRIPFLLDVAIVNDDAEMTRLDSEPALRRGPPDRGPLLHRLLSKRIRDTFSVDDNGGLLPTFEPRDDAARAERQQQTEAWLTEMAATSHPFDHDAVAALAQYVAGADGKVPVGVIVQQIVGRMFDCSYTATRESYEAARVVNAVLSSCPVDMARTLWWKLSGRLAASRALLWRLANDDPIVIHSTAIAIHNIVDSLKRMRAAMRADGPWCATPAQAVEEALVAPPRLMRQCVHATKHSLRPGTLVFFDLEGMHRGTESNDLAFVRRQWNQCPAHAIVPRLLQDVWRQAASATAMQPDTPRRTMVSRIFSAPLMRFFTVLNRCVPWYGLPKALGFLNLAMLRTALRQGNLYDTSLLPSNAGAPLPAASPDVVRWRTADGSFNDLHNPNTGRAGTRFGRNMPLSYSYPDRRNLLEPNPRRVSRQLLTRSDFIPARTVNVLTSAWTQFQIHDWFAHGNPDPRDPVRFTIPIEDGDPWPGERPMRIRRSRPDPTRADDPPVGPPTFVNQVTHWWDASQLYGSDLVTQHRVRRGPGGRSRHGKLYLDGHRRLALDNGIEVTGFNDNWWVGLSLFHHLFTYEHNAICDRLRAEYPAWDDEQLFQTARLINAALIAKIHETEWTPTLLAHPTTQEGMKVSWWGLLGEWVATHIGRFHAWDMLGGVPGSATNHHAAPFAMTEEFVSVYRMHAFMLPDAFEIYSWQSERSIGALTLRDVLGPGARQSLDKVGMENLLYTFGRALPGQLTLGNYARTLQQFLMPGTNELVDLATVDIVRDRERGVPRYNQFRELLRMPPIRTFEELNVEWAERLQAVYGTVDRIDLLVGLLAEAKPPGYGISDTAFRIFLLMNSRRMKSDRFYTADYRPEVYTQIGLDWIDDNDLRSVLRRHYPMLEPVLPQGSLFAPWREPD
jgi:Animal haem peroxidase